MSALPAARRDRFFQAAVDCFVRYGYRRTSMEVLAQAADMSRPAVYQYFRNKEEVFRAAVAWGLEGLAEEAEREAGGPGGAAERLSAVLGVVLRIHGDDVAGRREHARFHAELMDETYARARDIWTAFEGRILGALRSVLADGGAPLPRSAPPARTADVATVLLCGVQGIALHPGAVKERERLLGLLIAMTVGT
ncbi:helix-turn-helix domain-containing protein [Streptomyces sp. NPDC000594]|uniref:TetR/AcrR family transcriptional regulator n=1 Tax=Streptomyces sp. NPDC000594 TaxID=3154261 RepID=UPI0033342378